MLASSNIEEASQMSNLQGNAHDPGMKTNARRSTWSQPLEEKKVKHVEIVIQVKEEAKHIA